MKKCPSCQKTYEDSMKFCQIDGTPLVDDAPPVDPYKTIVSRSEDIPASTPAAESPQPTAPAQPEPPPASFAPATPMAPSSPSIGEPEEILDVPSAADPLKTMYVSEEEMRAAMGAVDEPAPAEAEPPVAAAPSEPAVVEPEPPAFIASELEEPRPTDTTPRGLPFGAETSRADEPQTETSPAAAFDATNPPIPSPFDAGSNVASIEPERELPAAEPEPELPPADFSQEPETVIQPPASPFSEAQPAFTPEATPPAAEPPPFAEPEPFQPAVASQYEQAASPAEWTPPPAPDAAWQNQQIGQDTPFQAPPPGTGTQSKGLAIGSLVCGILSCLCCFSVITGPVGVVLGFIARKKATEDPQSYGGDGLALGGMITGALGFVIGVGVIILQLFFGVLNNLGR